jgi:hypothetical protein
MHCKDHAISLTERHYFSPRLHPWPLFHQHELTTGEVLTWSREEKRDLQRKDEITIHVLVKTIEIAFIVLQQKRSGPNLFLTVALFQKGRMRRGVSDIDLHGLIPAIRDFREIWVKSRPQCLDCLRQWICPILVFVAAKTMPRQHDPAAEMLVAIVARRHLMALFQCEPAFSDGASVAVQIAEDLLPVECGDTFRNAGLSSVGQYCAHFAAASLFSSALFLSTPHR